MADKFQMGDVVTLKSGGPAMTVISAADGTLKQYTCTWFKGASKEQGRFPEASIEEYVAPSK